MTWVLKRLRCVMHDVATCVESLVHARPSIVQQVLSVLGIGAEKPLPPPFERFDITLRGIVAAVKSGNALPKLPTALATVDTASPTPEEVADSSVLPLPWDAYEMAQSLHDFAEQLGSSQVRIPGVCRHDILYRLKNMYNCNRCSPPKERLAVLFCYRVGGAGPKQTRALPIPA